MALYRNISGIPQKVGFLYGQPIEDMQRGDGGGGGGGGMYPVDPQTFPVDYNPDGADVVTTEYLPEPVHPILPLNPGPEVEIVQPNVLAIKEPRVLPGGLFTDGVNWTGAIALVGLTWSMITGDGKGWAPWLFAGGCGVLYLEMKKRNEQPVGIEPVRTL